MQRSLKLLRPVLLGIAFSITAGHARSEEENKISEEELLYHFERISEMRDSPRIRKESGAILRENSETLLPLLAKKFREKSGDLEYQSWIALVFVDKYLSGDKTLILDDLRELLPTLDGETGPRDHWSLISSGLLFLGRHGNEQDLGIIDLFSDHRLGTISSQAADCRAMLEKRLATERLAQQDEQKTIEALGSLGGPGNVVPTDGESQAGHVWIWTGIFGMCVLAGLGLLVIRNRTQAR